jgi:ATP-dependent DNA helicase DinG
LVASKTLTLEDYLSAFPFPDIRQKQHKVLEEICDAFNCGYKVIVLEAPTGFGKSPVAMCVARTLGSSYTCSATKELQTQYVNDFPFLRSVKGMGNFTCLVREDFALSDNYRCGQCGPAANYNECRHKSVGYGPCRSSGQIEHAHIRGGCPKCEDKCIDSKFHNGCRYRTYQEDYSVSNRNTVNETIFIDDSRLDECQKWYKSTAIINTAGDIGYSWMHLNNLKKDKIRGGDQFQSCPYYDQLNKGLVASHSIFNYANFLIFLRMKNNNTVLPEKELLVLDEGHQIENQIVEQVGISITRRTLQKYISTYLLEHATLDYSSNMEEWLNFLKKLHLLLQNSIPTMKSEEIKIDAKNDLHRLEQVIEEITLKPDNWIVSNIEREGDNQKRKWKQQQQQQLVKNRNHNNNSNQDDLVWKESVVDNNKIIKIEFKPLDVSRYCKGLFEKCSRTLIMSATILDIDAFCRNVGLDRDNVKFIQAGSDFPIENRPIYQMDTAYLNFKSLELETTQRAIANAVDRIMSIHNNNKGIIHATSYAQVRFIEKYISHDNKRRLIYTDPERPREEVTAEHFRSTRPSVLISPSLHTGLDLKDERSRFQILVKVPYPSKGDRWISAKMERDPAWYNWQTKLRLVQAYGRSVRSKDDWAKTYVLDSAFGGFVRKNRLPGWFMEAIQ